MLSAAVKELQAAKNKIASQIKGLEAEAKKIINAIEALSGLSGHSASPAPVKRRKMSAAGRKAIAAAARARWAKIKAQKAGKVTVVAAKPAKKKRTISAAARAAMAAGSKARWAKIKAAKK